MYDIIIKNGIVYDGEGHSGQRLDLGIVNGRIQTLAPVIEGEAQEILNVEGQAVSSGFIDVHSHCDLVPFMKGTIGSSRVCQGITTELIGQCGLGPAPYIEEMSEWQNYLHAILGNPELAWNWPRFADYLNTLDRAEKPNNVASLVSHGAIRAQVLGLSEVLPDSTQMKRMQDILAQVMEDGAWGISYGLGYLPGVFAPLEELIALSKVVTQYEGIMMVHVRSHARQVLESIQEVLTVARESGVKLQISHMRSYANRDFGANANVLMALVDDARQKGIDVSFDEHPYLAGSTLLSQVLPPWAKEGGGGAIAKRLQDPSVLAQLRQELTSSGPDYPGWDNYVGIVGWSNIMVSSVERTENKAFQGKTMDLIAKDLGLDEIAALAKLLVSENAQCCMVMLNLFSGEDTIKLIKHPLCLIGSDGIPSGLPHPRVYGTYPKFLKTYVRERQVLSWEEAIKKLTGDAAKRIGLKDRGFVRPGQAADLVIFDPKTIGDHEDYSHPAQTPSGIAHVFVNGNRAVQHGKLVSRKHGQMLKR